METGLLGLLLGLILSFFSSKVRHLIRSFLASRPAAVWAVPMLLGGLFCSAAGAKGELGWGLAALVAGYLAAPVALAAALGAGPVKRPGWGELAIILMLWLPLEFAAGASFVSKHSQGFLHSVAYGVAILLAMVLFGAFRPVAGLKWRAPVAARDWWLPLAAFVLLAPVLIVLGVKLGFMPPFHASPRFSVARYAVSILIVLAGTGLPEEILFRSLVQNLLMQRLGDTEWTLWLASAIFGAAHLDNGPLPLPNWRYAILATLAGYAYGKVFQKAGSVFASAGLHALVDTTKHFFF